MPNQKINERNQATPPGIPIVCLLAFCFVVIPGEDWTKPLVLAVLDLRFLFESHIELVFTAVPVILLVIAELLYKSVWRSLLFSFASISLVIEWVILIGKLKPVPVITFLSSLPFLIVVLFWNARSLNFMLRLEKRWTSLP